MFTKTKRSIKYGSLEPKDNFQGGHLFTITTTETPTKIGKFLGYTPTSTTKHYWANNHGIIWYEYPSGNITDVFFNDWLREKFDEEQARKQFKELDKSLHQ